MKQPDLGKRISELRKAKGLTQEELVEMCNLNVRTIQRIEAGEVTPRSYTVKALFEALGVNWDEKKIDQSEAVDHSQERPWLIASFIAGLLYFILSFFEIGMDLEILEGTGIETTGYVWIKLSVLIFFSFFLYGYTRIAQIFPNSLLSIGAWVLIGMNAIWILVDLAAFQTGVFEMEDYFPVKLISVGLVYILIGFGFLQYKKLWSNIPLILGAMAIVTGVLFVTVIGSILAIFPFTLFEIGQLTFIIWVINTSGRKSPSTSAI